MRKKENKKMRHSLGVAKMKLLQARCPNSVVIGLKRLAAEEGVTVATLHRRILMASVDGANSLGNRVRAIELAMLNYGIVPEGVLQAQPHERDVNANGLTEEKDDETGYE